MKVLHLFSLAGLLAIAHAAPTVSDTPTPEQFAAMRKASPMDSLPQTPADVEKQVLRAGEQSLIKQSEILNDGTHWTLVPKGAVLHVPPSMANRVGAKPLGTLLPWMDFLMANRAWLSTEETTFDQAAGKTPLMPERLAAWPKLNKVVVAVHQGGPISVIGQAPAVAPTPEVTKR